MLLFYFYKIWEQFFCSTSLSNSDFKGRLPVFKWSNHRNMHACMWEGYKT